MLIFVIDNYDLANLPRINTGDIIHISIDEKVSELATKMIMIKYSGKH